MLRISLGYHLLQAHGYRQLTGDRHDSMDVLEETEMFSDPLTSSSCEVVSRRRAFSTTCACRRRTIKEEDDYGLECIENTMKCPGGQVWNPGTKSCGGGGGGGGGPSVAPVPPPPPAAVVHRPNALNAKADNPVVEIFMYRAQEYEGADSQYALENVDMADLPGVMQYLQREVITENVVGSVDKVTGNQREARKYDISNILEYRFLVKNPNTQSKMQQDFHGYETYDFGQASNKAQWNDLEQNDHVGVQRQVNRFVPFVDPYYWFSLSGFCPNLPFSAAAITAVCQEDQATRLGSCSSKSTALPRGCATHRGDVDRCLCYKGGDSVVWGGLCGATAERAPPSKLEEPTGQRGCTYSYDAANARTIHLDELVGITNEECAGGKKCVDYKDFRMNCANPKYRKQFTALGSIKTASICVEYDLAPDCVQMGCNSRACKGIPAAKRELGLPFWKGRCNAQSNSARVEAAQKMFGIEDADTKHIVTRPPSEEYANVKCDRNKNLECRPNVRSGEGFCTRAWSGVCTSCRLPGHKTAALNKKTPFCPWNVLGSYPKSKALSCKTKKAGDICCLYFGSCDSAPDGLNDDSFATVLRSQDTAAIKAYLIKVASELLDVAGAKIKSADSKLNMLSYWAWGLNPVRAYTENDKITLKSAADKLNKIFPGSKVYSTTTTTTTTTSRTFRKFVKLTTTGKKTTTTAEMPMDCLCDVEGNVNGVETNRPGCAAHMGRRYGNFCYMEGGKECPDSKFSKKLGLWYRKCDPDLELGAP